ncbi:NUDIX hydrolase [Nocardia alni]|uniref:NUDIX hydrolase n=1 Tax=Nocardia alni TaxID=2815723 RepID=UPI001C21A8C7|nr:NUDIX hydrolase [Nocardia alni]
MDAGQMTVTLTQACVEAGLTDGVAVQDFNVVLRQSIGESALAELQARADEDDVALRLGVIIERRGEVLLLDRAEVAPGRLLMLPGTTVKSKESLAAAVYRAVLEETGLIVTDISRFIGSFDYLSNAGTPVRRLHFAVDVAADQPIRLSNYAHYVWLPLTGELPVTSSIREILTTYRDTPAGV